MSTNNVRRCDDPTHEWETVYPKNHRPVTRCRTCSLAAQRANAKSRYHRRREGAFEAYGQACSCCGEPDHSFLVTDHIDGGGTKQRRDNGWKGNQRFYAWLEAEGYPPGFQTLCHNCNHAKHVYGRCPHAKDL